MRSIFKAPRNNARIMRLGKIAALILGAGLALAATAEADSGIGVAPSIVEVAARSSGSAAQQLIVFNQSDASRDIAVRTGSYKGAAGDYSGAEWLKASTSTFQLGPGERRVVTVGMDIPEGLQPGGRYASVVLSAREGDSVAEELTVPFLILVGSPQQMTQQASLERAGLLVDRDGRTSFRAILTNLGNRHIVSRGGEVSITQSDGTVAGKLQIASGTLVLPGGAETVAAQGFVRWQEDGLYRLSASLDYGGSHPVLIEEDFTPRTDLSITRAGVLEAASSSLELELWNGGTIGVEPLITLEIRNSDGGLVSDFKPQRSLLWPDKRMQIVAPVPNQLGAGSYTLRAHVDYGAGKALERSVRFQVGSPSQNSPNPVRLMRAPDPASQRFALGLLTIFVLVLFGSRVPALVTMWRRSMRAMGVMRVEQ